MDPFTKARNPLTWTLMALLLLLQIPAAAMDLEEAIDNSSALSKYVSKNEIHRISNEIEYRNLVKGKVIIVDTRDRARCLEVERQLHNSGIRRSSHSHDQLCTVNDKSPYSSVIIFEKITAKTLENHLQINRMNSQEKTIFTETRNLSFAAAGVAGLLYMMPTSISKWDREDIRNNLGSKYQENIKNGPIKDKDDWAINYIGHPVSGAAYYQVARNLGLSPLQSFGYSLFMSTFFWEYGVEALAETPSIQDLWITPILGSLLGEVFFHLEKTVEKNKGKVLGSKTLGSIVMVLLDPAGSLSDQINKLFNREVIKDSKLYLTTQNPLCEASSPRNQQLSCNKNVLGLKLEFTF